MKRIVLCFDGPWDMPVELGLAANKRVETNVSRFYDSLAPTGPDGVAQLAWYNEGVGRNYMNPLPGSFGLGLDRTVLDGYCHLVNTYEEGDEVFIFGFSRGAYAARSMVGMIRNCGLVQKSSPRRAPWSPTAFIARATMVPIRPRHKPSVPPFPAL